MNLLNHSANGAQWRGGYVVISQLLTKRALSGRPAF
jgi:hypothetical protein